MNKYFFSVCLGLLIAIGIFSGFKFKNKSGMLQGPENKNPTGFAVVELFTSEGCSSCPPADVAIARLLAKKVDDVYILSFHVDYWNRLGWKDVFSDPQFSRRQNDYATKLGLGSVYTPQAIVNGTTEFVGSDQQKLSNAVEKNLGNTLKNDLTVSAKKSAEKVTVNFTIDSKEKEILNIAIIQPKATTDVKHGENKGRQLHHVNIVRELKSVTTTGIGEMSLIIPATLKDMPLRIIAYTQSTNDLHVTGVAQLEL